MSSDSEAFDRPFPFQVTGSLAPLLDYWRQRREAVRGADADHARFLLELADAHPEIFHDDPDPEALRRAGDIIRLLLSAVLPLRDWDDSLAATLVPFRIRPLFTSAEFEKLGLFDTFVGGLDVMGKQLTVGDIARGKTLMAYWHILSKFYGVPCDIEFPLIVESRDSKTGLQRFHRLAIDQSFVQCRPTGALPRLDARDIRRIAADPTNLELWASIIDPGKFSFFGFSLVSGIDVTPLETLSRLKQDLLGKDALTVDERLDALQTRIQTFLGKPGLRLGILALDRCESGQVSGARAVGRSILLDRGLPECSHPEASIYFRALQGREAVVVSDLGAEPPPSRFERRLLDEGIRNILIAPLMAGDEVIGLLELGATAPGVIRPGTVRKLEDVTGLFATSLRRSLDEQEDRIQSLIKKKYTAIHPVVEWKFRRAAIDHITDDAADPHAEWASVSFDGVIPMYGMSDIRGSSMYRARTVQEDLADQLGLALSVIISASAVRPLPSLDEIGYRLAKHIDRVQEGLRSGDEGSLVAMLHDEVEPLFDEFESLSADVDRRIREYRSAIDPVTGILYRRRRAFDESVTKLNDAVSSYIDRQEEYAQELVPHYFEKYRTDGIEYNIYAGPSLLENRRFASLDLRNLRLWQLTTMAGITGVARRVRPDLEVPLEMAHLILIQSLPLSIRFRVDEKKFDVDGSYNVRYEILKNRIDKAVVSGSGERLTQPDRLSIVYSQESEAEEYRRYLEYLTAAGYFEGRIETLELEDLPGVSGLKALRVSVPEMLPGDYPDQLTIETIIGASAV